MTSSILSTAAGAAERGGVLLAYASFEGALVIALVWVVSRLLARGAPSLRCALWWVACLKLLVGLSGIVLMSLPLLPATAWPDPHVVVTKVANPSLVPSATTAEPIHFHWSSPFVGLWILGVFVGLTLTARQMSKARAVIQRAAPMTDRRTSALFANLSLRVGLKRTPELRVSEEVSIPQVVGVLAPVVILPRAHLDSFSESDLAMALCHELVHVRRSDLWLGWVPALARRIFFFHPAAAAADHEYRVAREAACDAEVLRILGGSASGYGQLLLKMSVLRDGALTPSAAGASPFLDLRRRLHMLEHTQDSRRVGKLHWAAVAILALAILVPVRVVARTSRATDEAHPEKGRVYVQDPSGNAYVYFLDDHSVSMNGSLEDDLPRARSARGNAKGELLWFRLGGDEYLVRDASVLRFVRELQVSGSKLESGQEDLGRKQDALGSKVEKLAQEEEKVSARLEGLTQKRDELREREDGKSEDEMDKHDAEALERLTAEIRRLEDRQKELQSAIESLSHEMETLGAEQDKIGSETDRSSRLIDEKIYRLLEESIHANLAERVQ